jgi:hypothetical protein
MNIFRPAETAECSMPSKTGGRRRTHKSKKTRKSRRRLTRKYRRTH